MTEMFIDTLFPITCIFCGNQTEQKLPLCGGCEVDLPWITQCCRQCAIPLNTSESAELLCPQCQLNPPPFERTWALFHYQHPINCLITQLKFQHKLLYAKLFGLLLANFLRYAYQDDPSHPSLIIPMPLHTKRLRERGFNQALEIARPIAKELQIPLDYKRCQRIRYTDSQSSLKTAKQRAKNVKTAFIAESINAPHVLIIDDVITTGSTVKELSSVLSRQTIRVDVACCARTKA